MQDQPPPFEAARSGYADVAAALRGQNKTLAEVPWITSGLEPHETLKLFAEVDGIVKAAEGMLKRAKALRELLDHRTIEALGKLGLKNAPLDGGPTVYSERKLWAKLDVDEDADENERKARKAAAIAALKEAGLGEYVEEGFNSNSLSAVIRERETELEDKAREEAGLAPGAPVAIDPEEILSGDWEPLRGAIAVSEVVKAKARTS
jgi:hypothetical protein